MTSKNHSSSAIPTINRSVTFILAITLVVALLTAVGTRVQGQTCRTKTNVQNLVDLQNSTVTYLGGNNFRIHFALLSDPSITLICASSGQQAPCGFDGAYFRSDQSSHIIAESSSGDCNLKSTITTDGGNFVLIGYEIRFELNGNPSKQLFGGFTGMSTDPNRYPGIGVPTSLANVLL